MFHPARTKHLDRSGGYEPNNYDPHKEAQTETICSRYLISIGGLFAIVNHLRGKLRLIYGYGDEPHKPTHRKGHRSEQNTFDPLVGIQRNCLHKVATVSDKEVLHQYSGKENQQKEKVCEYSLKYVAVIFDASGIEFIKDLHEHKYIKDNREVFDGIILDSEIFRA